MDYENLDLKHKELLYDRLRAISVRMSEFSFANLYLFRNTHQYKVHDEDGCVKITGLTRDLKPFFLPLCHKDEPDMEYVKMLMRDHGIIFPVSKEWLASFQSDEFVITHDINDSDYIYAIDKMASYPGRKLHSKRNLYKQFEENYTNRSEVLGKDNIAIALELVNKWQHQTGANAGETDFNSAKEALTLMDELHLEGILYFADDKPAGYILGEGLTEDTFVFHFAKGDIEFKGIYQFMFSDYAQKLTGRFQFLNLEQDLGLQQLRQAKSSYHPDIMADKYRVGLRA